MIKKNIIIILSVGVCFLFLLPFFSSAGFGVTIGGDVSREVTVTVLNNGTDTNESTRFIYLTGTDCVGTDKVIGVQDDGTVLCAADQTGAGGGVGKVGDLPYLYNNTDTMFFNETHLNFTIDNRATGSENASWNESHADSIYIKQSEEGNLNTNSSGFWGTLNTFNVTQMEQSGSTLTLLESWLTSFFNALFSEKDTDDLTEGSTNLYDDQDWNKSYADTLYVDTNESAFKVNLTLTDCPSGNYSYGINSNGTLKCRADEQGVGTTDTQKKAGGSYLYNDSDTIYVNATILNNTITSLENDTTYNFECSSGNFVKNLTSSGGYTCDAPAGGGDITLVTAGTGLTGGGDSGDVTLNVDTGYLNDSGDVRWAGISVTGDNASWNESHSDNIYIKQSEEENLNTNSSNYWDDYNTANVTQINNVEGVLNIIPSWLTSFINSWFSEKDTDDLVEGSTNLYDNQSWNESHADTLYAEISVTGDNASWNESGATDLFTGIEWDYNQTTGTYDLYNTIWSYTSNETLRVDAINNTIINSNASWTTTFNDTYDAKIDTNYSGCPNGYYGDGSGTCLDFNTSVGNLLTTTYHNATTSQLIAGSVDGGSLTDTQHPDAKYDGKTLNFSEASGSPGLELRVNFTGITSFSRGIMRYKTSSIIGDYPIRQLWNYANLEWEDYPILAESQTFSITTQTIYNYEDHVQDGVIQMRIYKASNGNTQNHYYIDWVTMAEGVGVPSGQEIDPLSLHRDGNVFLTGNWNQGIFNFTNINSWFKGLVNWSSIQNAPIEDWTSTYNSTYDSIVGDNESWNESHANTLYSGIEWAYNQTTATFNLYDIIWRTTFNSTYDSIVGDNADWNKTYADTLYIAEGEEANLNVNSSNFWDTFDTVNATQINNVAGVLNIIPSWITSFIDAWLGEKSTDDLTEGSSNLYDNQSWNESGATDLFTGIEWDYNQTTGTYNQYGDNWYNHTSSVNTLYGNEYRTTFNSTYDSKIDTTCNSSGSCSSGGVAYMDYNSNNGNLNISGNLTINSVFMYDNGTDFIIG